MKNTTRRDFFRACAAGATATIWAKARGQQNAAPAKRRRPNILLILIDDMGYADLGCYGNTFCDTPNIDRLARQGMRFTNGYACAPICSASRSALLTGRSTARLGFEFVTKPPEMADPAGWDKRFAHRALIPPLYTLDLPLEEETIAETLGPAGYATGITGKWHVSAHHEHYLGWSPTHGPLKQGFEWGSEDYGAHPYGYKASEKGTFGPYTEGEYPADELTGSAIGFMEKNRDNPFFLFVSHYYVHVPLGTKCKWLMDKYAARAKGKYGKRRALYGAFLETMDHYVGQLLDALDDLGLSKNTLVVLTSDNGGHPQFAFNAPLRGSKWNLYEGGIRVPFMARWPGAVPPGATCDVPVAGTDLLPTFCEAAGATPSPDTPRDGISILPVLTERAAATRRDRSLYWHFPYYHPERKYDQCPKAIGIEDGYVSQTQPQSAIRKGNFKLVYFYEDERCELYDLKADVSEQRDLSSSMPAKTKELKQDLLAYLRSVKARLPRRNPALSPEKTD